MHVALFVTYLVNLYRPRAGFAAVHLLEQAGCRVSVPSAQTCCGQPAYNNGDTRNAQRIARQVIETFEPFEAVIVPSGSCAGMLRMHYPRLFDPEQNGGDPAWHARAEALAARCHELTGFLHDVLGFKPRARYAGRVACHDSCSALRELGLQTQPRALLGHVDGVDLHALREPEQCCGFGGTFCVKYPEISARMVSDKVADIEASGADTVVAADLGCLLNIAGRLSRLGKPVRCLHIAELLAGMGDEPAIGESVTRANPRGAS